MLGSKHGIILDLMGMLVPESVTLISHRKKAHSIVNAVHVAA